MFINGVYLMGWEIKDNRFFCNTSDEYFGPWLDPSIWPDMDADWGNPMTSYFHESFSEFLEKNPVKRRGYKETDPRGMTDAQLKKLVGRFEDIWPELEAVKKEELKKKSVKKKAGVQKAAKRAVKKTTSKQSTTSKKSKRSAVHSKVPPSKIVTTYDPSEQEFCLNCRILPKIGRAWEITDEAAIALAESGNYIWLVSLRKLSDKAAAAFAASKAEYLFLDSIDELSDSAIETLSQFKGEYLSLGILDLSEAQAKLLSDYSADHRHQTLILNSLSSISPEAISHLAKMKPKKKSGLRLQLDGLGELSDDAARELANFGCNLNKSGAPDISLNGLERLSPMLAKSMHEIARGCSFRLGSVRELSVEVATAIASIKWESQIRLEGLVTMSVEVAAAFAGTRHKQIYLNTSPLPEEAIQILCKSDSLNLMTDTGWYGDDPSRGGCRV